ncbi:MAG: hypothetical protein MAG581_01967 [Deltaproteobacteria bacterium]|jgi:hypothetical protein|nr:hypothetical protein [Deltaproteobacteria bacterium]
MTHTPDNASDEIVVLNMNYTVLLLPLTPALPSWERGDHFVQRVFVNWQNPLPQGEGGPLAVGEGK